MKREHVAALQQFLYGHAPAADRHDLEAAWKAVKVMAGTGGLNDARELHLVARMCEAGAPAEVIDAVLASEAKRAYAALDRVVELGWQTAAWIVYEALTVASTAGDLDSGELDAICALAVRLDIMPTTVEALAELCREEAALRMRRIAVLSSKGASCPRFDLL